VETIQDLIIQKLSSMRKVKNVVKYHGIMYPQWMYFLVPLLCRDWRSNL